MRYLKKVVYTAVVNIAQGGKAYFLAGAYYFARLKNHKARHFAAVIGSRTRGTRQQTPHTHTQSHTADARSKKSQLATKGMGKEGT